jgi:TetR/AcrR family transcriptional regulator, regulator of autoinduction and epiphytic fitness
MIYLHGRTYKERTSLKSSKKRSLGRPRSSDLKQPTKQIILQAATELFLYNGFKEVSVDDVANKCNITKATVYYYFDSKAELFTETMVQMMYRIRGYIQAMLEEEIPLRNRLLNVAKAHLQATVDIDLEGFMRETKSSISTEQLRLMQQAEESMFHAIEKVFIDEIETGKITRVNPKFAAHSFISLLKVGNYRNSNNEAIFRSVEETAEQIIKLFWNGLFYN